MRERDKKFCVEVMRDGAWKEHVTLPLKNVDIPNHEAKEGGSGWFSCLDDAIFFLRLYAVKYTSEKTRIVDRYGFVRFEEKP